LGIGIAIDFVDCEKIPGHKILCAENKKIHEKLVFILDENMMDYLTNLLEK